MTTLKIKQGETFSLSGQYLEDDGVTPKPLTGVTLSSQIRDGKDIIIANLTLTVTDINAGTYEAEALAGTLAWPTGLLYWDIKESIGGVVRLSDTHTIKVERAITKL